VAQVPALSYNTMLESDKITSITNIKERKKKGLINLLDLLYAGPLQELELCNQTAA
jgi:hypothetical protein